MQPIRILCVGIGGYANVYLEALLKCPDPDFTIVGMVDVFPEGCRFLDELKARGIPLFATMEEFFENGEADLAIITTPIQCHTPQVLCALAHGCHVMCEKPLSGVSADAALMEQAAKAAGRFVMIGYQWSYSAAVNALKRDITAGRYGVPQLLKTLVLWPRPQDYFTRGAGWGGKRTVNGVTINDSVANNAAAHYLHNILYVTGGADGRSSEVKEILSCDLCRTNAIENFDTAGIRFLMDNGATGVFVGSHATKNVTDPIFEYQFSDGTVRYDDTEKQIVGHLKGGRTIRYGNPFADVNEKIFIAIRACREADFVPLCGIGTAAPHVRCIEMVQQFPILDSDPAYVKENGRFLYVDGWDEILKQMYRNTDALADTPGFRERVI